MVYARFSATSNSYMNNCILMLRIKTYKELLLPTKIKKEELSSVLVNVRITRFLIFLSSNDKSYTHAYCNGYAENKILQNKLDNGGFVFLRTPLV